MRHFIPLLLQGVLGLCLSLLFLATGFIALLPYCLLHMRVSAFPVPWVERVTSLFSFRLSVHLARSHFENAYDMSEFKFTSGLLLPSVVKLCGLQKGAEKHDPG